LQIRVGRRQVESAGPVTKARCAALSSLVADVHEATR
jgi:hypothetical protein